MHDATTIRFRDEADDDGDDGADQEESGDNGSGDDTACYAVSQPTVASCICEDKKCCSLYTQKQQLIII